jgi:hypothetical protein
MGFIASQFSNTVTVTHGLGTTPPTVQATADSGSGAFAVCTYKNITATTFQVVGWSPGTLSPPRFRSHGLCGRDLRHFSCGYRRS